MAAEGRLIGVIGALAIRPMHKLSIPGRRLLAYLALRGGAVARSIAAAELWAECVDEAARANLRRALWQVPAGWIAGVGDMLLLEAECDLPRARLTAARALEGHRLTFDDIDLLCRDVLPGWYDDWAIAAYEAFRLLRVQALEAACRALSEEGNHALAVQAGAAAVAAEPLSESATAALVEAHLAQRNRYEAVRAFRALEARLREELGVTPEPELAARVGALATRAA
jgi:DNA-binding SARP family transcriptional activator